MPTRGVLHATYWFSVCSARGVPWLHASYWFSVCTARGVPWLHASYWFSVCTAIGVPCLHASYWFSVCTAIGVPCLYASYWFSVCSARGVPWLHASYWLVCALQAIPFSIICCDFRHSVIRGHCPPLAHLWDSCRVKQQNTWNLLAFSQFHQPSRMRRPRMKLDLVPEPALSFNLKSFLGKILLGL